MDDYTAYRILTDHSFLGHCFQIPPPTHTIKANQKLQLSHCLFFLPLPFKKRNCLVARYALLKVLKKTCRKKTTGEGDSSLFWVSIMVYYYFITDLRKI